MRRGRFGILAFISTLLLIAACVGWVRSYSSVDKVAASTDNCDFAVTSSGGRLVWTDDYWPTGHPNGYATEFPFFSSVDRDRQPPLWEASFGGNAVAGFIYSAQETTPARRDPLALLPPVRVIGIPWWFVALWLAAAPVKSIFWHLRAERRREHGLCPRCGHDLRGGHEVCPECGAGAKG